MNKKNDKNICLCVFFVTFAKSLVLFTLQNVHIGDVSQT